MAAGEKFSSPDKSESKDSDSGNKKSSKRTAPFRAPLFSSPAETPAPKTESQAPKRLFDIIAEQQLHEQMMHREADSEATDSDKSKKKSKKKKGEAEKAEPTQPEVTESTEASELDESLDTDAELSKEEEDKPVADGAVEIALDDTTEEEIALSDRVKEWNRARPQSPPTAPMSEVGLPTVAPREVLPLEAEATETRLPIEAEHEVEPVIITEPALAAAHEPVLEQRVEQVDEAPVAPPIFEWQPQPQLQHQAEMRPTESAPEKEPVLPSAAESDTESSRPLDPEAVVRSDDMITPPHNPLFAQQGVDPALMQRSTQEAALAPPAPAVIERTVHHRPSDFWPGVFVGGAVEHIRHKRRERKMEKSQKLQQSRIAQLEYTQRRTALEQQTESNERLRAEDAARYKKPVAEAGAFPMPSSFAAERGPEQLKAEQQPKQKQLSPEQPVAAEEVKPLEGHHIEKSAWHKIEVDDRTGHVAENSNIVYGEAFQRERRPEQVAALQAQQQAEAEEQEERAALHPVGVPTLPRPQIDTPSSLPGVTPRQQAHRQPTESALHRSKTPRPVLIQSGADMALWGGLVLVVLAIIAALAL